MKNKGIVIFLIFLGMVIIGIIAADFISKMPDKRGENPYELNIDEFSKVDSSLILYKEQRNFKINFDIPAGICFSNNKIYLVGDNRLQIIEPTGKLVSEINLDEQPTCVFASPGNIIIGYKRSVSVLKADGSKSAEWKDFGGNTVITSIAEQSGKVFVADAGKRKVWIFNLEGKKLGEFEGKTSNNQIHGFIVPSPYFDLAFNADGELWVVNPGKHSLENYTSDGVLRTFWENQSIKIEGFNGCCNPAHFAFAQDGSFVTSEKDLVRIKIYKPSGEFQGVVAPPSKFEAKGHAPDVAVDDQGNIYALDFDKRVIRLFEKKQVL
jgi:DNA-binding beta-propeller fold protein YncE